MIFFGSFEAHVMQVGVEVDFLGFVSWQAPPLGTPAVVGYS